MPSPAITGYASWARADDDLVAVPPVEGVNLQVGQGENRALVVVEASTQDFSGVQRQNVTVQGVTVPFIQATDSAVDRGQTSLHAISGPAYDVIETEGAQTVPVIAQQISGHENLFKYVALALSNVDTAALTSNVVIFEGSQFSDSIVYDPATYKKGDLVVAVCNYTQDRIWTVGDNGLTLVTESASGTDAASSLGVFQKFATQDETNIVHTVTYDKGSTQGGAASANGNRKTGMLLVFKGVEGAADPLFAPVDFELGSTATVTQQAGSFDFDNAATHLVIELPTAAEISIPLTTGTTTGGTLDTVEADLDGALNQINIDTTYTARLEVRTGATVDELSQDFDFQMTTSASTAYFWGGISVADLQADTTITPAGVASDSAALSVQMKAQVPAADLQAGDTLWYQGPGAVTPTSLLESLPAGAFSGEYREFYQATQAWSEVLPVGVNEAPSQVLTGETVHELRPGAGAFLWPSVGATQVSGGTWSSDGACVRPDAVNTPGEIVFPERLTENRISMTLLYPQLNGNDSIGGGFFTDATMQNGNFWTIATIGTDIRIEFKRILNGVIDNLDFVTVPITVTAIELEYFRDTSTFNVKAGVGDSRSTVKTVIDVAHTGLEFAGIKYEALNTNGSCVSEVLYEGQGGLQIAQVNGSEGIALVDGTDTLQFTVDHAPTSVTYTDIKGVALTDNAPVVVNAREVAVNLDLSSLWKGAIAITTGVMMRTANYVAPAGFKTVVLGADVSTPMSTAGWSPGNQLTYPDTLTILPSGHTEVPAGALPQSFAISENDGTGYAPAVTEWYFEEDVQDVTEYPLLTGATLNLDLTTIAPYLSIPQGEVGSGGTGWSIAETVMPAGFSVVGTDLTGSTATAGAYPVTLTFTSPSGAVVAEAFMITASSGIVATDDQIHTDSAAVTAVSSIVPVSPIDTHAHSDSAAVIAITTLPPIVVATDTQIHTDSTSAYGLATTPDNRQIFILEGVAR